jgi:hypothetical protein
LKVRTSIKTDNPRFDQAGCQIKSKLLQVTEDVVNPMNGSSTYLTDLCEFNYIKSVLNGSQDFVGILSGGNVYQFRKTAPLFIVDLYGSLRRLPTSFSANDVVNGEVAPEPVVNCVDSSL